MDHAPLRDLGKRARAESSTWLQALLRACKDPFLPALNESDCKRGALTLRWCVHT